MNITKVEELENTLPVDFEWKGVPVHMDVYESSFTSGFLKNIADVKGYPVAISRGVKDWNVTTDDNGTKLELSIEALDWIPPEFLVECVNQISSTWAGDKKKPKNSDTGSAATAK